MRPTQNERYWHAIKREEPNMMPGSGRWLITSYKIFRTQETTYLFPTTTKDIFGLTLLGSLAPYFCIQCDMQWSTASAQKWFHLWAWRNWMNNAQMRTFNRGDLFVRDLTEFTFRHTIAIEDDACGGDLSRFLVIQQNALRRRGD